MSCPKTISSLAGILLLVPGGVSAEINCPIVPVPSTCVVLDDSPIKEREVLNTTFILSIDPERLLHNFRINSGVTSDAQPLEGWEAPYIGLRGHFTGHYLSALSMLVERYHTPELTQRLDSLVSALAECQQKLGGGYLSAFPDSDFDTLEQNTGAVWAPFYTYHKIMQGMLDAYLRGGNRQAYDVVTGMAAYVARRMAKLDDAAIERILYTVDANPGNEPGAMNEVFYNLYAVSQNPEHLMLGRLFDREWLLSPLASNRDILSGLHSNTHIAQILGFARAYELTGEEKYRDAVSNFWNILMSDHAFVNGSSSGPRPEATTPVSKTSEHWGDAGTQSKTLTQEIAESCVSYNTRKLTGRLFCWTGESRYAESCMNLFYNAVLPAQNNRNGRCLYHLPLNGPAHKSFLNDNDFRCCNGTGIETFASLNRDIYFTKGKDIFINLYIPSALTLDDGFKLSQKGCFPENSAVCFTVSATPYENQKRTLRFFIPSWAENTEITVNGRKIKNPSPLSYAEITRKWKAGDSIKLEFKQDFHIKPMSEDPTFVSLYYGPMLLAIETDKPLKLNVTRREILSAAKREQDGRYCLSINGARYALKPLCQIDSENYEALFRIL